MATTGLNITAGVASTEDSNHVKYINSQFLKYMIVDCLAKAQKSVHFQFLL